MNPLTITLTIRPAFNGWIIEQRIGQHEPCAHAVTSAWGAIGQLARLMADWERMMAPFHKRPCEQPYAAGIPAPALAADALDTISATYAQPPRLDVRKIGADVVAALAAEDAATQTPEPPQPRPAAVAAAADDAIRSTSPAQAPGPAAAPRKPGRPPLASWTAARLALLADINALPGEPITMKGLMNKASAKGVKRDADAKYAAKSAAMAKLMADESERARRAASARAALQRARPATPPPPNLDTETTIALPPAAPSPLKERVREAMANGVDRWDIWAGQQKAALREAYQHIGEIKRERMDAA